MPAVVDVWDTGRIEFTTLEEDGPFGSHAAEQAPIVAARKGIRMKDAHQRMHFPLVAVCQTKVLALFVVVFRCQAVGNGLRALLAPLGEERRFGQNLLTTCDWTSGNDSLAFPRDGLDDKFWITCKGGQITVILKMEDVLVMVSRRTGGDSRIHVYK